MMRLMRPSRFPGLYPVFFFRVLIAFLGTGARGAGVVQRCRDGRHPAVLQAAVTWSPVSGRDGSRLRTDVAGRGGRGIQWPICD
ncbi:hypothetical protein IMZ48_27720 [Candidatus Bathyarchaeota archaeon]|nr:hypothetical protein [Candidatus Bathyarchaeota archaeon]